MTHVHSPRGFTLLVAVILTSVILSVALSLLDVAYKQVILASTARQSSAAFYTADSGMECALYWDSKDTFDYTNEPVSGSFSCEGQSVPYTAPAVLFGNARWTTFSIPCGDGIVGDAVADITVVKQSSGSTYLYSNGYNTCKAADPQRIQRGVQAKY